MKKRKSIQPFAYDLEEADLKRERQKARELRGSQWWKRRVAKGECHYCRRGAVLQVMQHRQKTTAAYRVGRISQNSPHRDK